MLMWSTTTLPSSPMYPAAEVSSATSSTIRFESSKVRCRFELTAVAAGILLKHRFRFNRAGVGGVGSQSISTGSSLSTPAPLEQEENRSKSASPSPEQKESSVSPSQQCVEHGQPDIARSRYGSRNDDDTRNNCSSDDDAEPAPIRPPVVADCSKLTVHSYNIVVTFTQWTSRDRNGDSWTISTRSNLAGRVAFVAADDRRSSSAIKIKPPALKKGQLTPPRAPTTPISPISR